MVQWLETPCSPNSGGKGSIPGRELRPCMAGGEGEGESEHHLEAKDAK